MFYQYVFLQTSATYAILFYHCINPLFGTYGNAKTFYVTTFAKNAMLFYFSRVSHVSIKLFVSYLSKEMCLSCVGASHVFK